MRFFRFLWYLTLACLTIVLMFSPVVGAVYCWSHIVNNGVFESANILGGLGLTALSLAIFHLIRIAFRH